MVTSNSKPVVTENFVKEYGGLVHSIARRMIQDPEKIKDATQEVWIQIIKSLPAFNGKSKLSTWIYRIATRVIMNYAKNEVIYSRLFIRSFFALNSSALPVRFFYEIDENADQDRNVWIKERCSKCLTGFLHCLKNEARLALLFRDIAGLSYGEISEILGNKEVSVRQTVTRSRRKVLSYLNDNCVLQNPDGDCRCHLKKHVYELDLPEEIEKLKHSIGQMNLFVAMDHILPPRNFWEF